MCPTRNQLHSSTFPSFNFFLFTKEDGTSINNEDRKQFSLGGKAKIYSKCSRKNQRFEKLQLKHLRLEI